MILALDLGAKVTGWAIGQHGMIIESGYWLIQYGRLDDYGIRGQRLQNHLSKLYEKYPFMQIVFEAVNFTTPRDQAAVNQLYGLMYGAMALWCKNRCILFYGVEPQIWKKEVIGKGNASKDAVRNSISRLLFKTIEVQDQADAIAILLWRLRNERTY